MSWTTPRTWTTGETVTAAMLNEQVRDNTNYLKGRADIADYHQVLDHITADTTIASTTNEGLLYSFQVPANTLGTTGALYWEAYGYLDIQTNNPTLRLRFGGTSAANDGTILASISVASAVGAFYYLSGFLKNVGATNSNRGQVRIGTSLNGGTGAVDTTSAQYFKVTIQEGNGSQTATLYVAKLIYCPAV